MKFFNKLREERAAPTGAPPSRVVKLLSIVSWGVAGLLVVLLAMVIIWQPKLDLPSFSTGKGQAKGLDILPQNPPVVSMPSFTDELIVDSILRVSTLHTNIPTRSREGIEEYTVSTGDSLFAIAKTYSLEPETILWANYDLLNDNPDMLSIGDVLKIPPVDGILHKWKSNDTVDKVAAQYRASKTALLAWPGNNLDMTNPVIEKDTLVMIPGGSREFITWIVPTIARGRAGVTSNLEGTCDTGEGGLVGGGNFMWPTPNEHVLSGNEYWSGHLGIDIAAGEGTPIYASDSGVVVISGWNSTGYGYMILIDHGNGWQTLYAHLSKVTSSCGSSVARGGVIGYAGSTGNSTGSHLHFETRYLGGFVNPWSVVQ